MISEHWKIAPLILKKANLKTIKGYKKDKGIAEITIRNNDLLPGWCNKKINLFLEGYSELKGDSDCVVEKGGKESVFLSIDKEKILVNNFDRIVDFIIHEKYYEQKQPFFSKFPVKYTAVPVKLRVALFKVFLKFMKDPKWPNWPIESSVEVIRHLYIKAIRIKTGKPVPYISFWPGHKSAFCVTHDCDTASSFTNIEKMREIEKAHGIKSSWNILSHKYAIDTKKIKSLKEEGCEIGLHGYNHDNTLPFLKSGEIRNRISKAREIINKFGIDGFRSPSLLRNERLLNLLSDYFSYDSSTCDTDIFSPVAMRSGVCTVFPFFINNMVEIPITIPQDWRLIRLKKNKNQIFDIWKLKIDFIRKVDGCAVLLTHPDTHIFGNDEYLGVYDRILKYATKRDDVWKALPYEIANWWKERKNSGIHNNRIIGSKRASIEYI